jgi:hypothetical protein
MLFIESTIFTKLLPSYFIDEEYIKIQNFLMENPDTGDMIKGAGGLRKLRWRLANKGKRGGVRIIYYWHITNEVIYFMTLYAKNEITDLSAKEKKLLKQLIEEFLYG